ncbi:HNH endonuclease [Mycobacterium phage Jolie2]|uniref:HNH endonuclease n=1 Tax=Mycobacterium phage Jolie2 TaxID=1458831 RepID=W8EGX0_9CAUD|nr:HNH endonuclease [Mycobacterium phage Jolie2]AHJ86611.1 HNH endonuclease [Mycobacterium phage Jolie2]
MSTGRNTATRDRDRLSIRRGHPDCGSPYHDCKARFPNCGICGEPIDYELPYLDPWEFVVDHVIPLIAGGEDVLSNKQAAHRCCNRDKSDQVEEDQAHQHGTTFVTTRTW